MIYIIIAFCLTLNIPLSVNAQIEDNNRKFDYYSMKLKLKAQGKYSETLDFYYIVMI